MLRKFQAPGRADALDSGHCSNKNFSKGRGPVKRLLVIGQVEVNAVTVGHCARNAESWSDVGVQSLIFAKRVLWPRALCFVHTIYNDSEDCAVPPT